MVVVGVNERDHGSLYNTQLVFDADGSLVQARRKITPTYHERMLWGQGRATACKRSTRAPAGSGRSPAGNTTTRSLATR